MADTDITKTKNSTTRAEIDIATTLRQGGAKKQEMLRNLRATLVQARGNLRNTSTRLNSMSIDSLKDHSQLLLDNVKKTNELLRQVRAIDSDNAAVSLLTQIIAVTNREINFVGRRLKGGAEDFNNASRDIRDLSSRVRNSRLNMNSEAAPRPTGPGVSINRVGNFVINRQSRVQTTPVATSPISANRADSIQYRRSQTQIRDEAEQKEWEKGFWQDFQRDETRNFDEVIKAIKGIKPGGSSGSAFSMPDLRGKNRKIGVPRGGAAKGLAAVAGLGGLATILGYLGANNYNAPNANAITPKSPDGPDTLSDSKADLGVTNSKISLDKPTTEDFLKKILKYFQRMGGGSLGIGAMGGSSAFGGGGSGSGGSGGGGSSMFPGSGGYVTGGASGAVLGGLRQGKMGAFSPGKNSGSDGIGNSAPYTGGPSSALKNSNGTVISTADTSLAPHQRALLDTISKYESGSKGQGYNTLVGGGTFEGNQHPGKFGGVSTAAGRYQFLKGTWESTVKDYNKKHPENPITDFSPANQDRAAYFLAQKDYTRRTGRDLETDLKNGDASHLREGLGGQGLNTTWQGFQGKQNIPDVFAANLAQNKKYKELENVKPQMPQGTKGTPDVVEKQAGIRNLPIKPELKEQLQYAAEQAGVQVEIGSGGQESSGPRRTGSHRHDDGGAADLKLYQTNEKGERRLLNMNNPGDAAIMQKFTTESMRAGATGVGAGQGYMGASTLHIGGGTPASWGGAPWIKDAYEQGRIAQRDGKDQFTAWQKARADAAAAKNAPAPKDSITAATPENASIFKDAKAPSDLKSRTLGSMVKKNAEAEKESNTPMAGTMAEVAGPKSLNEMNELTGMTKGQRPTAWRQDPDTGKWKSFYGDPNVGYGASFKPRTDSAGSSRAPYTPPETEVPKSAPFSSSASAPTNSNASGGGGDSAAKAKPQANAPPDIPSVHSSLGLNVVNSPAVA